jgi:purine nucleoside phosphorylase
MTLEGRQFAVIAGSGFPSFGGDSEPRRLHTGFGSPSSPLYSLRYGEHKVHVLARHGEQHELAPHRINYRANMAALAMLRVDSVIALNTVGVVRRQAYPGQLAVPDQLIDYTWGRDHSIYGGNSATLEHVDFTTPFCEPLRMALLGAAARSGVDCHDGGVYGVTQGPRLETAAEVGRYERDGVDYLGMTAMPEASLARELGMNYACLSLIVNFAAGRGEKAIHDDIDASTLTARMRAMRVLKAFFQVRS